jgi:DNA repair protein RecO (recombination protein O)
MIVSFYTRKYGKIKGVVKGVKRLTSRFGCSIEPFTYIKIMFYSPKENNDKLNIIQQSEIIKPFKKIREDLTKLSYALFITEITDNMTREIYKDEKIFRLVLKYLNWLEDEAKEIIIYSFCLKLLCILGFKPVLDQCVICRNKVLDRIRVWFSRGEGGIICPRCNTEDRQILPVSMYIINLIHRLIYDKISELKRYVISDNVINEIKDVTFYFLEYYITAPIKSAKFVSNIQFFWK